MQLKTQFNPIRDWGAQRGIYQHGNIKTQMIKLTEEFGELAKAVLEGNKVEVKDAVGDMVVVLTSVAYFKGLKIEDCINHAYKQIAKRKGIMKNGTFVKDKNQQHDRTTKTS